MLFYYLFWMFMGFIMHFYIIFGTNLLTQSLVPVPIFPLFQCFEEKEYLTESKRNESFGRSYFWKESNLIDLECTSGKKRGSHEVGGAPTPLGRALHPRGPLVAPLTYFFRLYISIYPKMIGEQNRSGVPPQASVATKNQSGPCSGTLSEGGSLTGGHLQHPGALHDEEGVVHPRG